MLKKLSYFLLLTVLTGCYSLRPSLMLRTPRNYKFDSLPTTPDPAYKISSNDIIELKMYSNDGFKLIDLTTISGSTNTTLIRQGFEYIVEFDGTVKLPIVGRTPLKGMTIREAEVFLEDKYTAYYNKPFVLLKVTNKRVIVFPGSEGNARVIALVNENTTLIEALALAGGIFTDGKARRVKLIRGDPKAPKVYLIDLSTISGMKEGDIILQANDIIYVESRGRYATKFISEIAPYISFITSSILFYELIKRKP